MSHPAQSGAKKKRWPWWLRLLGWLFLPLLAIYLIIGFALYRQADQHSGGRKGFQEDTQAEAKLRELQLGVELERLKTGRYPTEKEGGLGSTVRRRYKDQDKEEIGEPEEVKEKILDPWGRRFKYRFPGVHNKDGYDLYSLGSDGIEDTEDDIKNW